MSTPMLSQILLSRLSQQVGPGGEGAKERLVSNSPFGDLPWRSGEKTRQAQVRAKLKRMVANGEPLSS